MKKGFKNFSFIASLLLFTSCFKEDKVPPQIYLYGDLRVQVPINTPYIEPGFKATDNKDGDLTYLVEISDSVNTELANFYLIYYNVSDASGNKAKQASRIVEVHHTVNHLTTVYFKSDSCTFGNLNNNNVTINPRNGYEYDFKITGITENGRTLNAYLYGNNKRFIKIPVQTFTDTTYFGEGIIDPKGNIIEIILNRQIQTHLDSCKIRLTRFF